MSIYIKGMEMPKSCNECRFFVDAWCYALDVDDWRNAYNKPREGERLPGCPLIPVPDHGRLIDADALVADLKRQCKEVFKTDAVSPDDFWITRDQAYNERLWTTWCEALFDYLKAAPTIIPAEEHSPFYESLKRGLEQAINGESRSETISADKEGEG